MPSKSNNTTKSRKKTPGRTPAPVGFWQKLKHRHSACRASFKEMLGTESYRFIAGICTILFSLYLIVCLISNIVTGRADQAGVQNGNLEVAANYGGKLGAYISNYFMDDCFGVPSILIPIFTLLLGVKLTGAYQVRLWKWFLNFAIVMIWGSLLLSLLTALLPESATEWFSFRLGGGHGDYIRDWLIQTLGQFGIWIVVVAVAVFYFMYLTSETVSVVRKMMHPQDYINLKLPKKKKDKAAETKDSDAEADVYEEDNDAEYEADEEEEDDSDDMPENSVDLDEEEADCDDASAAEPHNQVVASAPELTITDSVQLDKASGPTVEEVRELEPYDPRKDLEHYKFPTLSLLQQSDEGEQPVVDKAEQHAYKERIINVLRNFGVEISSIKATVGPTITLFEVTPAPGVRINKIRNLEDDIALSLSALGIRIIAPIPGKGTIGIEVPNKNPRIVLMESIINTRKFQESTFDLPIALGKTITNEVFMVDLAKMPHLLVAGATGQGKSVGLNAIITSLLYKKHPSELKFVMVDPKKVEFSIYSPIEKHFLAKIPDEAEDPIITDVTKVVQTLKSLCQLMDQRYILLKMAKVRNIKEYNAKFKSRQLNPDKGHDYMPYIVVIIDEFGDLIMTAGKEVELPIARIAQLARAVGIHMVIATQRPTTNIITGTIKANFPARMAFKVMSQIDSRTILDQSGANQLIGKGDMLFLAGNTPVRVQCAYVDTQEVEKINDFISHQQGYLSAFELPEPPVDGDTGSAVAEIDRESLDPMFEEAARLIMIHQQGSTSLIQRKFAIGYNRAGRLMDQLERAGIVGPVRGSKPREVLVSDEMDLEAKIAAIRS